MEACILIPSQLSLRRRPKGSPRRPLDMDITLSANCDIKEGVVFHPDVGDIRLDKLESYGELFSKDVSIIQLKILINTFN